MRGFGQGVWLLLAVACAPDNETGEQVLVPGVGAVSELDGYNPRVVGTHLEASHGPLSAGLRFDSACMTLTDERFGGSSVVVRTLQVNGQSAQDPTFVLGDCLMATRMATRVSAQRRWLQTTAIGPNGGKTARLAWSKAGPLTRHPTETPSPSRLDLKAPMCS